MIPLPPNATFKVRHVTYTPVEDSTGVFGVMEVVERWARTSRAYIRRYLVKDLGMSQGQLGRQFRIKRSLSAVKDGEDQFYNVLLSIFGSHRDVCECRGHISHGGCIHIAALRLLVREQAIPARPAERPAEASVG